MIQKDIIVEVFDVKSGINIIGANTPNDTRTLHYEININKELQSFYNSAIVKIFNLNKSARDKLMEIYDKDSLSQYKVSNNYFTSNKLSIYILRIKEAETGNIFYIGTVLNFYATYTSDGEWSCTILSAQGINLNGLAGTEYLAGSISYTEMISDLVSKAGYNLILRDQFENCPFKKINNIQKNYNFTNTSILNAIKSILSGCEPLPNIGIDETDNTVYIVKDTSDKIVDVPLNNILALNLGIQSLNAVIVFNFDISLTTQISFKEAVNIPVVQPHYAFKYPQWVLSAKWLVYNIYHKLQNYKQNSLQRETSITAYLVGE